MRLFASEVLNGAIFAALVVMAGAVQGDAAAPTGGSSGEVPSGGSPSASSDAGSAVRESFAVPSLAGASLGAADAGASTRSSAAVGTTLGAEVAGHSPAPIVTGQQSQTEKQAALPDSRNAGQPAAATESALPKAVAPGAQGGTPPAAKVIDAFVPPVRRRRPVTPPLVSTGPTERKAAGKSRKAAKPQVKRAARSGQDAGRSALGGTSGPKQ